MCFSVFPLFQLILFILFQMELRLINLIIFAMFFIGTAVSQLAEMKEIMFPSSKKYCGSNLSQALSTICQGSYNTIVKKNESKLLSLFGTLLFKFT